MRLSGKGRTVLVLAVAGLLIVAGAIVYRPSASADLPRVPTDDSEVLEHLPAASKDPRSRRVAELRQALAANPNDETTALALAQLDIVEARARSDPRYLGHARAALAPWWDLAEPPPEVLVLRATIKQSLHDFEGALADLDRVVVRDPEDAQAWITRAVVLTVRGRYAEARASCAPLDHLANELAQAVCAAGVDAVTGHAAEAYARVERAKATLVEREWAESTLGEIAVRLGRNAEAARHFTTALSLDPGDGYAMGAYADLLLDTGRAAEVTKLLANKTENDGLLLRLALAEAAVGAPDAKTHAEMIAARFDAAHLRGDRLHLREESRFELGLRRDAKRALELAIEDFGIQKEPWDVRVVLEAANAAGDPAAAKPALDFMKDTGLEDPCIHALASSLKKGGP